MIMRPIGQSGESLPVIGLGTWQTFDQPPAQSAELSKVLSSFVRGGGAVVDTSPMYGRAEEMLGTVRRRLDAAERERLFLATKVWTSGREAGSAQMKRSLGLIGVEKIDLIQVHNLVDWRTHLETLRRWKEEGLVRYIGITHYLVSAFDDLESIMSREKIDFVQLPYSMATRNAEQRLLPLAQQRGIAVLVNRPFEEGSLFRRVAGKRLPVVAQDAGCKSWGELFLRWIVSHPAITSVIPATSSLEHLRENLAAGEGRLFNPEERTELLRAFTG